MKKNNRRYKDNQSIDLGVADFMKSSSFLEQEAPGDDEVGDGYLPTERDIDPDDVDTDNRLLMSPGRNGLDDSIYAESFYEETLGSDRSILSNSPRKSV